MTPISESDRQHSRSLAWGLDLMAFDVTTDEEKQEFRRISAEQLGAQQTGLGYWLDTRPDVLKRYRFWADKLRIREADEAPSKWSPTSVSLMWLYSMTDFEGGLRYALHGMNRSMTKDQILELVSLVFRYVGPRGMSAIANVAQDHEWVDPVDPLTWPSGWAPDPGAFESGADFSVAEASEEDIRRIVGWYEKWIGEVPDHVRFVARHRPELFKAYRNRYENTLSLLPKQTEPWAMLQINMLRSNPDGIREGMLLGRAFGITKTQILEAISWGTFYGGNEALGLVHRVAGDILDAWEQ